MIEIGPFDCCRERDAKRQWTLKCNWGGRLNAKPKPKKRTDEAHRIDVNGWKSCLRQATEKHTLKIELTVVAYAACRSFSFDASVAVWYFWNLQKGFHFRLFSFQFDSIRIAFCHSSECHHRFWHSQYFTETLQSYELTYKKDKSKTEERKCWLRNANPHDSRKLRSSGNVVLNGAISSNYMKSTRDLAFREISSIILFNYCSSFAVIRSPNDGPFVKNADRRWRIETDGISGIVATENLSAVKADCRCLNEIQTRLCGRSIFRINLIIFNLLHCFGKTKYTI